MRFTRLGDLLCQTGTRRLTTFSKTYWWRAVFPGVPQNQGWARAHLRRNLCLAVARREDFLGLKTKKGECVYLALEEREEDIRKDFQAMGADGSELSMSMPQVPQLRELPPCAIWCGRGDPS